MEQTKFLIFYFVTALAIKIEPGLAFMKKELYQNMTQYLLPHAQACLKMYTVVW